MTHRLAILGAGVMGTGIATLAVGGGLAVTLIDVSEQILDRARAQVTQQLRLARLIGALPAGQRPGELTTATDLSRAAGATAVIEAVTERADVKASVLEAVSTVVKPGTVLISNTSAIPIDELARAIVRPGDLLGVHFMNPAYRITTVEVVRGPRTSEAALAAGLSVVAALGREPVVVGDGPGFVVNRVLQRMINESARIVAEGVSSAEDVDALFTGCLGHRSGPLATADLIGLDNVVDALTVLLERTGDVGYAPCDLLLDKVKRGELGRKSGRGFFDYPDPVR